MFVSKRISVDVAIIPDGGSCRIQKHFWSAATWGQQGTCFRHKCGLQAPSARPSIIYAEERYPHDAAVETGRRARFIYLANAGTRLCNDFKRPLQHFVPDVHWVCCAASPRRLRADERDPVFVYRSYYNYRFLRITGRKVLPSIVSCFLPVLWFHHSLVFLVTKEHKVRFKSTKVKCN